MNLFLNFIYFIIALFIYTHIVSQYKKSHDLKVYESDFENNAQLQTVCDIKQPVAFQYASVSPDFFALLNFTPFRISDAQRRPPFPFITAHEVGVLNEKRCNSSMVGYQWRFQKVDASSEAEGVPFEIFTGI